MCVGQEEEVESAAAALVTPRSTEPWRSEIVGFLQVPGMSRWCLGVVL